MTDADTLVLLSGGLDSVVLCAQEIESGRFAAAVHFIYEHPSQSHERRAVAAFSLHYWRNGKALRIVEVNLPLHATELAAGEGVKGTRVVPCRNLAFVAVGCNIAAGMGLSRVVYGATLEDADGYIDCRPAYVKAASALCQPFGVTVEAPLARMSRAEIRQHGASIGAPLDVAWSCYQPSETGVACGSCNSCLQG